MPFRGFEVRARWLLPAALAAAAPKCLLCLAAYAGVGATVGLRVPELCGAVPAEPLVAHPSRNPPPAHPMSTPSVTLTKRFAAPAERVFDAWLDPAVIGQWMFGPNVRDEHIVRLGTEPRVGGRFSFVVRRGDAEVDHVGEYLELDRPRRLVFTWGTRDSLPATSRVTVEIAGRGDECELTLTHELDPAWAAYADRTRDGWSRMLEALARLPR